MSKYASVNGVGKLSSILLEVNYQLATKSVGGYSVIPYHAICFHKFFFFSFLFFGEASQMEAAVYPSL